MKILINTASTYKGGSVQVALSFIQECKNFSEHQYEVVLGEQLSRLIIDSDYPGNFNFHRIEYRPATRVFSLQSPGQYFKEIEKKTDPDVVFTTSGPAYWRPKSPHLTGYNLPHYIYRDSPFFEKISFLKKLKWDLKGALIKHFFKRDSDAYVVQTDDVNDRVREWLKTDRVYTVSNTYGSQYFNPRKVEDKLQVRKQNEFRLISLSSWYPHKNLGIIPAVIDNLPGHLKENIRFVLTLPAEDFFDNFSSEYHKYIYNVGPVKPDECPSLYNECDAMFLPTLLECFSASYAEAMVMRKPIVTSDLGFARTVCKDAALYAEPINPADYAQKITQLYNSEELRNTLIQKGKNNLSQFSTAEARAEEYLSICKLLADAGKN